MLIELVCAWTAVTTKHEGSSLLRSNATPRRDQHGERLDCPRADNQSERRHGKCSLSPPEFLVAYTVDPVPEWFFRSFEKALPLKPEGFHAATKHEAHLVFQFCIVRREVRNPRHIPSSSTQLTS